MTKEYEVLEKSFIGGHILDAGEKIIYDGEAGSNLKLITGAVEIAGGGNDNGGGTSDLEVLRQQYEELFNEKPHFNTGAAKLSADIEARRKELGI